MDEKHVVIRMRKPRSGFAAVMIDKSKVMIIGGNDGRVQNRVECLNMSNG